jgi:hypothetical protein
MARRQRPDDLRKLSSVEQEKERAQREKEAERVLFEVLRLLNGLGPVERERIVRVIAIFYGVNMEEG